MSRPRGQGEASPLDPDILTAIAGSRDATARLMVSLDKLDDSLAGRPSLLPGWSVGHVVTHLARNADSHTRMLSAAMHGDAVEQYAGGGQERAGNIEAGSGRSAEVLLDDMRRSIRELEAAWAAMTPEAWEGHGLSRGRRWPCRLMPYFRWREVEIHHVDMGTGYEPGHWPEEYVRRELAALLATVPGRLGEASQRRRLLGWLTGRSPSPGQLDLARWESHRGNYFKGVAD